MHFFACIFANTHTRRYLKYILYYNLREWRFCRSQDLSFSSGIFSVCVCMCSSLRMEFQCSLIIIYNLHMCAPRRTCERNVRRTITAVRQTRWVEKSVPFLYTQPLCFPTRTILILLYYALYFTLFIEHNTTYRGRWRFNDLHFLAMLLLLLSLSTI